MASEYLVEYKDVNIHRDEVVVLQNVNLTVEKGEFIYLCGKVGSGKSSLLKSLYAEVPIHSGSAKIFNYDLKALKRKDIPMLRRKIGIMFQDFKLLEDRTVNDNLAFVLKATGWKDKNKINDQIDLVLNTVGMSKKGYKRPHQLSGGEQQRIVIARALLNSPELIIADEPTGNLDPVTARELMDLLHDISRNGTSVLMATHNTTLVNLYPGTVYHCENEQMIRQENPKGEEEVIGE
ncbi:MAG: ATP-binding cassette domain-containing protein [Paludibacteraceae bacterium]|nr:ATP-binding cassette domain-containing protein [Paludibacteraceae bacterium]